MKLDEIRDVQDFRKMLDSHEWNLVSCEPYDQGGVISTMRCDKCGAEWSSSLIP